MKHSAVRPQEPPADEVPNRLDGPSGRLWSTALNSVKACSIGLRSGEQGHRVIEIRAKQQTPPFPGPKTRSAASCRNNEEFLKKKSGLFQNPAGPFAPHPALAT
jgi:hypothetical protein